MTVELTHVSKRFGSFVALHPNDLAVREGEFIALLGPSGCGKTTLLRLIAGFEKPTTGEIRIDGQLVSTPASIAPPNKRNLNMVFQSFALWPHMTVRQHVRFPLEHHAFLPAALKREKERREADVLKLVGLSTLADRYPQELSGGQRQRVALARAIASQPSVLLMDEPLSNLDAELRMEMRKEIQHIHRATKTTILYVTHDQSEALAMADRIVVMKDGKIEQIGTPQDIYASPETEFVATFVGKANLVKGAWTGTEFVPSEANGRFIWQDRNISSSFKGKQLYPVRPEQFRMRKEGDGIPGVVTSVQYQGKEIHYTVQTPEGAYTVHEDIACRFQAEESVVLQLKDAQFAAPPAAALSAAGAG
ncbi:ABC transporter ATP-binding protein [Paenibacillus sp.]|uniref:ABC transporter ATP-binding protein n=1 Tax=Paenibacillus sp. TaxID=58172 RepID=UPI002D5F6901|nr:ABC transporter ATP-binding protein [Paenibacillus sp.]HZG87207.1 ABC transporter ATP-binding protein [Paenibacillus sp.]